ncbi:MAG: TDT family transporter [Phascolarctobacterium sp.]
MIKNIPIPTAGVMLGLAALGNLLAPYSIIVKIICGILSALLGALLFAKIIKYPKLVHADLKGNPVLGSVFATFFMATMQLCTYVAPVLPVLSKAVWCLAVAAHIILIIWFSKNFVMNLEMKNVFPTYFIAYVGIVVGAVTSPVFNCIQLGIYIFYFGFAAYMLLLLLVTYRYIKMPPQEAAVKPLICIYTAPMSLSLAGYFAVIPEKSFLMITIMQICAQLLFFFILSLMPKLLRLPFYPSYAAFTFPFVITAIALKQSLAYYASMGVLLHDFFYCLYVFEAICAICIVVYVTIHYLNFFRKQLQIA